MKIKKEEWPAFAEFIARESTHQYSCNPEDGVYTQCPYSTMERAYTAFTAYRSSHIIGKLTREYWDENSYWDEVELCYEQQYPKFEWPDEADNYRANREKQIIRIAHQLADRYPHLGLFGTCSWISLVYPFYEAYELNKEERALFVCEYYTQRYLNGDSH